LYATSGAQSVQMQTSRSRPLTTAAAVSLAVVGAASIGVTAWALQRRRRQALAGESSSNSAVLLRLLYGSVTGTSEKWARHTAEEVLKAASKQCPKAVVEVVIEDLTTFSFDTLLTRASGVQEVVAILLSTQMDGLPPDNCAHFSTLLADHVHDFRVGRTALQHLSFAVIGFGSTEYSAAGHFCTAAVRADGAFAALSARRLAVLAKVTDTEEAFKQVAPWRDSLVAAVLELAQGRSPALAAGVTGRAASDAAVATTTGAEGDEEVRWNSDDDTTDSEGDGKSAKGSDMEDMDEGCAGQTAKKPEMLTTKHRGQLQKEGYKIIGSHSAVKLCRWTKHQLRGRGGCYKHSFYGITSYQCMEATPSLACANKCTFCWRHHKNPVATEWKWSMDPPDMIVAQGIEEHKKMIRECKGIPGVRKERFEEAQTVKHCALSLVGEPIMYPRINELCEQLHSRRISTFLVTNGQFPEAIHSLVPITQLYVSVDAGTPETLKAIDRPLFTDFWERYIESLTALKDKKQRTVYRLTLVKGENMKDAEGYAKLVALGEPDFIEIKSVTFCGESKASNLTIANTPWHEEVRDFCEKMLEKEGLSDLYEIACEHQHSCIVLLALKKYKIDGVWNTWINYDRFHELLKEGRPFEAEEYMAPTPDWAIYGSEEAGFDPNETRVYHKSVVKKAKAGLLSEAKLTRYPTNPAEQ